MLDLLPVATGPLSCRWVWCRGDSVLAGGVQPGATAPGCTVAVRDNGSRPWNTLVGTPVRASRPPLAAAAV